jgi:DNA-binding NarL/FixJ family response regulator
VTTFAVVLVGTPAARDRLRQQCLAAGVEVLGDAATLAAARAAFPDADAFVVAPGRRAGGLDDERDSGAVEPLTAREIDVLQLVSLGLANKAIAQRLGISDQTVKFHVASILGKLGASNRTDAVRLAVRQGLIAI